MDIDSAVAYLRDAGEHPLMTSFPQGAVFAFDRDLRYLSAGGLGLIEVGLSRELLEGKTIYDVFPAETAELIAPHYLAALDGISTTWDVPYAGRIFSQRLAPVTNSAGLVVAGIGFTQDVTEARAAVQQLQESEDRNRLTFENAPIGQAIVELDGRWRQINAAVTRFTGYSEQELLGMTFQDITHPEDLDLDLDQLQRTLAGEIDSYQIEKRYITSAGKVVWAQLSVAMVRDDAGNPLYFISQIQDISESKRQNQMLQDLTAMLAHDLRSPAAAVSGFAELLAGPEAPTDAERIDYASRIDAAAQSMTTLLENALTATTLGSGQLQTTPDDVELAEVVAAAVSTLDTTDADGPTIDTIDLTGLTAWVDQGQLTQALTNLLTNAIKYGGDRVTISARSTPDTVTLSVADNGPGIDRDFIPQLFERYSRSPDVRRGRHRGSGLGLFIVRELLALNSATIRYQPHPLGGAEFLIELPRHR